MPDASLYERLGGVFAIAAVVDHFSDAVVKIARVGQDPANPGLREWHTEKLGRLPGLKFMRTLWVCDVSGGPFSSRRRSPAPPISGWRRPIATSGSRPRSSTRSRELAARASTTFKVPGPEKDEVLAAFAAHKGEVTEGYLAGAGAR